MDVTQEWWLAVRHIADLVSRGGVDPDEARLIRKELKEHGFSMDGIGQAMEWLDRAALSGNLMDSLGMLQPVSQHLRIEHPLERVCIHSRLRLAVEACRRRGHLTQDTAERLLEGLRTADTRDWDHSEVEAFLAEGLAPSLSGVGPESLHEILGGRPEDHYN